jgi:hypothetical protein
MMNRHAPIDREMMSRIWTDQSNILGKVAEEQLAASKQLGVGSRRVSPFPLAYAERAALTSIAGLSEELQKQLTRKGVQYTTEESIGMVKEFAAAVTQAEWERRPELFSAAQRIADYVHASILTPAWATAARKQKPTKHLYQLKVTLMGIRPPIWRRIQVPDCTLDRLHELIQTSMGWNNSHLHQFEIDGQRYGDPDLLCEDFHTMNYRDSRITLLSMVLPKDNQRFSFRYKYDFGDSWEHEILFEGCPQPVQGQRYPLCVEGKRACPPEDVGGTSGYLEFLDTIASDEPRDSEDSYESGEPGEPGDRVEHLEWAGGWFDPEEFDATTATKSMWKGIFDWRNATD